ncbi:MAG TPA: hypothetical protein VIM98_17790 [Dyella sp.]
MTRYPASLQFIDAILAGACTTAAGLNNNNVNNNPRIDGWAGV